MQFCFFQYFLYPYLVKISNIYNYLKLIESPFFSVLINNFPISSNKDVFLGNTKLIFD